MLLRIGLNRERLPQAAMRNTHQAVPNRTLPRGERVVTIMKKLNAFALAVSKILEVLHWVGTAAFLALFVLSLVSKDWLCSFLAQGLPAYGTTMAAYGFELSVVGPDGTINAAAITLFSIGAALIFSMLSMIFRNVYLIFKTAKGETWFSQGGTPFQKDITRMVREIGIFYLAVPVIGLVFSTAARLVLGPDGAEINVSMEGFVVGILLLCLSQVFAYGTRLEGDVDGLV